MQDVIIGTYFFSLTILFLFGSSGFFMIYSYLKYRNRSLPPAEPPAEWPVVTIQLPVYNELYVVGRLIDVVCSMDYPKDRLEI